MLAGMWWWLMACAERVPEDQADLEVTELALVDASRETPSFGTWEGAPERALPTRIWIGPSPGEDAPQRPLLLIAHGVDGHPRKFEAFASDLARAGVVVAAPAFPCTNDETGAGFLGVGDLPEQPGDLTFVLDQLLAQVDDEASPLWHRFDPESLVTLGHSLGGATVIGWTRFEDPETRLDAVATLSPAVPLTVAFGPSPSPQGPPSLLLHGLEDPVVAYEISLDYYDLLDEPKWLVGLAGAEHSDPIESQEVPAIPSRAAAQEAVLALIAETTAGEVGAVDRALGDLADLGNETLP